MGVMQQEEEVIEPPITNGLQLWLDAADSSTLFDSTTGGSTPANNGAVARWEDKSGNTNHATQGTANERPLRITNDTNGNDVILFDGANDWFSLTSGLSLNNDITSFFVFKRATTRIISLSLGLDDTNLNAYTYIWFDSANAANKEFFSTEGTPSVIGPATTDTGLFLEETYNHTQKSIPSHIIRNGTETADGTAGLSTNVLNTVGFRAKGSNFMKGEICEITHYNRELTTQEITDERNRLATKWGITLV